MVTGKESSKLEQKTCNMGSDLTSPDPCKSVFLWAGTEEASFTISDMGSVKSLKMLQ